MSKDETNEKQVATITPEMKGFLDAVLSYNEEIKKHLIKVKSKYSNKDKTDAINEVLSYIIRNGAEMKKYLANA